jgi:hypothetical protein
MGTRRPIGKLQHSTMIGWIGVQVVGIVVPDTVCCHCTAAYRARPVMLVLVLVYSCGMSLSVSTSLVLLIPMSLLPVLPLNEFFLSLSSSMAAVVKKEASY